MELILLFAGTIALGGISVVKVFQQTVYSFKNFHAAISEYEKYAFGYALKCRIPLTGFQVALKGTFILLIPVACMIIAGVSGQAAYQDVILDFLFYSLFFSYRSAVLGFDPVDCDRVQRVRWQS